MIDEQTQVRMRLLEQDATFVVYAFHHESKGFMLLPTAAPEFEETVRDAMKQGATPVAIIALMKHVTENGEALIEHELFPGASEEDARSAAALFKTNLIEAGILRMDT